MSAQELAPSNLLAVQAFGPGMQSLRISTENYAASIVPAPSCVLSYPPEDHTSSRLVLDVYPQTSGIPDDKVRHWVLAKRAPRAISTGLNVHLETRDGHVPICVGRITKIWTVEKRWVVFWVAGNLCRDIYLWSPPAWTYLSWRQYLVSWLQESHSLETYPTHPSLQPQSFHLSTNHYRRSESLIPSDAPPITPIEVDMALAHAHHITITHDEHYHNARHTPGEPHAHAASLDKEGQEEVEERYEEGQWLRAPNASYLPSFQA